MKRIIFSLALLLLSCSAMMADNYQVTSPDGRLKAQIEIGKTVTYAVSYDGQRLLKPSQISLSTTDGQQWGVGSKLRRVSRQSHKGTINALFYKKSTVTDNYNELTATFRQGFNIVFRAYDEGLAYRFVYTGKKPRNIRAEQAELNFAKDWTATFSYVRDKGSIKDQLHNSFENVYSNVKLSQLNPRQLAFLPVAVSADRGVKVFVTEADVEDYPGLFVVSPGKGQPELRGFSAPYPKTVKQGGHNRLEQLVTETFDYIAKARGPRSFPWRIVSIATADKDLLNNDMVYRLAAPNRLKDTRWIKPGKVAWDWWNDWALYKVPFQAGINTQTYKYYIDFAAQHGIEYVILDEGWAVNKRADLFQVVPEINLKEIVSYAKSKQVGIILWAGYKAFDRDMERVCKHFSELGVKGFKIDFMNRDDAACVNFHYRAAAMAAKYHLLCDFHGTYKPTGLNRTYPNVLNFEGVFGLEQAKWASTKDYDQPLYDVNVALLRNAVGPMDYTQGAMLNSTKWYHHASYSLPVSQGTRCHQLAEYIVFYSPLNMMCDSPTHYMENSESTDFIARVPTVWDETLPLATELNAYVAVARRKGSKWYVGAITNWTSRDLLLDLSPLKVAGKKAVMYADGVNAEKVAADYTKTEITIPDDGKIKVHLASGGGVALEF